MISFMVGGGSKGCSETGASMAFTVDDPAHSLSVFVDYEEMHAKGCLGNTRAILQDVRIRPPQR
jgi:hypothetical protein